MTPLTPPRGFGVSPFRLGIRWMWQWKIVCPASWSSLMPMLKPVTDGSCSKMSLLWDWMISGKVINSVSFRSKKDGTCLFGMINKSSLNLYNTWLLGRIWILLYSSLVEAAGIEPASVSPLPSALHAYFVYYLTFCWPDKQGSKSELALCLTASTTNEV